MKYSRIARLLVVAALIAPAAAFAGPVQRYTLIVGANNGGSDRVRLKYAVSDAERFAQVMTDLGGVGADREVVLREPRVSELLTALTALKVRLFAARPVSGDRTEVFFYYSGHADEQGLLLGDDRLSYRSLRDHLDDMPADVRIAVLDACASGAFTRLKGGKKRPPFLVDESSAMRGYAFLTSSAETESAQESDRIKASYFTHYLVSGFRGAADLSGDGQVTLNEAYQFAFTETLGRTVATKAGAQHPSYDINLSGAGDIVITDVRQTTARLVLGEGLEGRFFIRNASQRLVVELFKPRDRSVEIALEPGAYEIRVERENGARVARAEVADGSRLVLNAAHFTLAAVETTRRRGDEPGTYSVDGRNRITTLSVLWNSQGQAATSGFDYAGGLQYARYLRENLAIAASLTTFGALDAATIGGVGGVAIPVSVQWNPRSGALGAQRVKPFLQAGLVAVSSADSRTERQTQHRLALGGHFGAGVDYQVAHTLALGVSAAYNFVPEPSEPVEVHDIFNGPEVTLRIGWLFGRGR